MVRKILFQKKCSEHSSKNRKARPLVTLRFPEWIKTKHRCYTVSYQFSYFKTTDIYAGIDREAMTFRKFSDYFLHTILFIHPAYQSWVIWRDLPAFKNSVWRLTLVRCQGLIRPQVPCTPSLHCPIANSASTQSQQPVNRRRLIKSSWL